MTTGRECDGCGECSGTGWYWHDGQYHRCHGAAHTDEEPAGGAGAERLTPPPLGRQPQFCQADVEGGPCRYCKRPWREWAYVDKTAWRLNECPAQMQAQANALHAALRDLRAALAGITPDVVTAVEREARTYERAKIDTPHGRALRVAADILARALANAQPTLNSTQSESSTVPGKEAAHD